MPGSSSSNQSLIDCTNSQLDYNVLKKLHLDKHSWEGLQKKELHLKLKECSKFLKEWNISSMNQILVPFVKQYMNKIGSMEKEAGLEQKINQTINIRNEIEKLNESLERNIDYNKKVLNNIKISSLESDIGSMSLSSSEELTFPIMEIPPLAFERINKLLDVIDLQEQEIAALEAKKKVLSPK